MNRFWLQRFLFYYQRHAQHGWFVPPAQVYADELFRLDAGGTCFTANSAFHALLAALGFAVHYVSIRPPGHMGNVVRLPEDRFYVDVGGGGPLFERVNLACGSRQELNGAGTHIHPVAGRPGVYHFEHLLHGQCTLKWELHVDEPLSYDDFSQAIAEANKPNLPLREAIETLGTLGVDVLQPRQ